MDGKLYKKLYVMSHSSFRSIFYQIVVCTLSSFLLRQVAFLQELNEKVDSVNWSLYFNPALIIYQHYGDRCSNPSTQSHLNLEIWKLNLGLHSYKATWQRYWRNIYLGLQHWILPRNLFSKLKIFNVISITQYSMIFLSCIASYASNIFQVSLP